MTRLDYPRTSISSLSEQDMKMAIKACLRACAHLHPAEPLPICHCDVRWANVLWDPQPFLADLETAHFSPWPVSLLAYFCQCKQCECIRLRSMAAFQVPLDFSLQDWDEGTLDDEGRYTTESDTYQIGVMLLKFQYLSADSWEFAHKLKSKSLSGRQCLQLVLLMMPTSWSFYEGSRSVMIGFSLGSV